MGAPRLETARLILRPPCAADFAGWAALMDDPVAAQFLGGRAPRAAAWRQMMVVAGAWQIQGFGMFSVIHRASGEWLGRVGPWYPEGWPCQEVGWGLRREYWGQGYATEAARAAIDYAFDVLDWPAVHHCIAAENLASVRVAQRLGSARLREAYLAPPFETVLVDVWGQTREQWRAGFQH